MKNIFTTALTGDNLIVTPNNMKSIASLKRGDLILTDKGIVTVDNIEVFASDAINVTDNSGNILARVSSETRVGEQSFKTNKKVLKGYKIDKVKHLKFNKQETTVDPYFLGLWLADGTSASTQITSHNNDIEVHRFLKRHADSLAQRVSITKSSKNSHRYSIVGNGEGNTLQKMLIEADLTNNKHVPVNYIFNDVETRMQLLAGMLDGDGYVTPYSFKLELKSESLIRSIQRITDSLGFKTSLISQRKVCTNSKTKAVGTYWKLSICGKNIHNIPTKLARKQFSERDGKRDNSKVNIKLVKVNLDILYRLTLSNPKAKIVTSTGILI